MRDGFDLDYSLAQGAGASLSQIVTIALFFFFFRYKEGDRIPRVIVDGFFSVPR